MGKLEESLRPSKMIYLEEAARVSIALAPSTVPIFQSLKFPANPRKIFARFMKIVDEHPNIFGKNDQREMILEGKRLGGFNFDHMLRKLFAATADYHLTGLSDLTHAHSKAKLSPSPISNTKFKT